MATQNKPYLILGKPNLGRSWQIWGYVGNVLVNLLETMQEWLQMAMLKRCAPKNDSERRWIFVKWTNDDPKATRKLGWIWSDLGLILNLRPNVQFLQRLLALEVLDGCVIETG